MELIKIDLVNVVQSKNVSLADKAADFLLKPAQYLWRGKKIDLICEGGNVACQFKPVYAEEKRSYLKTAAMIVLLLPALIIGGAFRLFATLRHHDQTVDAGIRRALKESQVTPTSPAFTTTPNKAQKPEEEPVFFVAGNPKFVDKVKQVITDIRGLGITSNPDLYKQKPLFLSEVVDLRIYQPYQDPKEYEQPGLADLQMKPLLKAGNQKIGRIITNTGLFCNLKTLHLHNSIYTRLNDKIIRVFEERKISFFPQKPVTQSTQL